MKLQLCLLFVFCMIKYLEAVCEYGVYESGLTEEEKAEALDAHNNARLMIAKGEVEGQPKGINLKRMIWDDKLAYEAQLIADTCIYGHVSVTDDRWPWVGQNLYSWWSTGNVTGAKWQSAVDAWFNEHELFTYGPIGDQPGTGHYTQVVWANSDHLGCGYVYFPTGEYNKKIYVCNYGPGGNYVGQVPYETGESGCENLC